MTQKIPHIKPDIKQQRERICARHFLNDTPNSRAHMINDTQFSQSVSSVHANSKKIKYAIPLVAESSSTFGSRRGGLSSIDSWRGQTLHGSGRSLTPSSLHTIAHLIYIKNGQCSYISRSKEQSHSRFPDARYYASAFL